MAALPYMQLYIADYLADTMHLSAEEHGAYLLLMFNYWQTGKPIPKNRLAKIARLTNERWADVEPSLREFFHDNGDEWVHLRIEEDLASVREKLTKKSAAGKASVQARRSRKEADVQTKQERDLTGVQTNVGVVFEHNANTKATNKDTDKELNPTHNARVRESAPTSEPNGTPLQVAEPEFPDGLSEPIGKFPMADGWHPSLDFRRRAALWGAALPESGANPFGLTVGAVMEEYRRWRNESWRYDGSDKYPWSQPVLYHICLEMRSKGIERQMTEGELKRFAERQLTKWSKHVGMGLSVPPVRRQLAAPKRPSGPTPIELLKQEYERRKAAGFV